MRWRPATQNAAPEAKGGVFVDRRASDPKRFANQRLPDYLQSDGFIAKFPSAFLHRRIRA